MKLIYSLMLLAAVASCSPEPKVIPEPTVVGSHVAYAYEACYDGVVYVRLVDESGKTETAYVAKISKDTLTAVTCRRPGEFDNRPVTQNPMVQERVD